MPIFKGPLFASHRAATKRQRSLTDLPVARGVVNEQDFLQGAGRATRLDAAAGRRTGKTLTTMAVPAHFEEDEDEHHQRKEDH